MYALAQLGSKGRFPETCQRELVGFLANNHQLVPAKVETPINNLTGKEVCKADVPLFEPHATMATLYEQHQDTFKERILPDVDELERFWNDMEDNPQLKDHPVLYRRDWKRRAIPLVLHGDGVPLTGIGKSWSKVMDVFSVSSLLGRGSTRMRMFLTFSFFTSLSATADGVTSSDRLFQRLVWSLLWAWRGKHPTHDDCNIEYTDPLSEATRKAGKYLCGNFFFVLWIIQGDLDHLRTVYGLPNANSLTPCSWCPANSGGLPWNDFRDTAECFHQTWTKQRWQLWIGDRKHAIFTLPGVSILTVGVDLMHIKHLGTDKYMYGSVLYLLCFHVLSSSPLENLKVVADDVRQYLSFITHKFGIGT